MQDKLQNGQWNVNNLRLNEGFSSTFLEDYQLQWTPKEDQRVKWPKNYGDEKTSSDKSV